MLISFLALVALLDMILAWVSPRHSMESRHPLGQILGYAFWPVAWVIGIPAHDCAVIGNLLRHPHGPQRGHRLHCPRRAQGRAGPALLTIATFALCGFANLGSIGMQIGGIGALVPERRNDLAKLGVRAMLAGTMANLISASIAGMFLG